MSLLYEHLDLDGELAHPDMTPEIRRIITDQMDEILSEILEDREWAGASAAENYRRFAGRRNVAMQRLLMDFAMKTGVAQSEFREFAREAILRTDLSAPRDGILTMAVEYLYNYGDESDLEVMSHLDGHINQTYARIKDAYAARLVERLEAGEGPQIKFAEDSASERPSVRQTDPALNPNARHRSESINFLIPIFAGLAGLALLAIFLGSFRNRKS